jgi:tRNA G18 (ribose-2'-O)-methylase SpoU
VDCVSSAADPRVQDYRNIKDAGAKRAGLFVVESERVLLRLVESTYSLRSVLLSPTRYERIREHLPGNASVFVAEQEVLEAVVGFALPRGVIGLADRPAAASMASVLTNARCVVMLENVSDPENLGAVFRHVACFGSCAVVLSPHAGDPLYRKSVRASMGWSLHVPWARFSENDWPGALGDMRADGWNIAALTPDGDAAALWSMAATMAHPTVFLLGSEHDGLSQAAKDSATSRIRIPMAPGVDSLNVATTAAIALYEWQRAQSSAR